MTKQEFDRLRSTIISFQNKKYTNISEWEYIETFKTNNQTKFNPYLYNREKDLLENGAVKNLIPNILKKQSFDIIVHNLGGGLGIKDPLSDVNDWNKVWYFNVGIALEINSLIIPLMKKPANITPM